MITKQLQSRTNQYFFYVCEWQKAALSDSGDEVSLEKKTRLKNPVKPWFVLFPFFLQRAFLFCFVLFYSIVFALLDPRSIPSIEGRASSYFFFFSFFLFVLFFSPVYLWSAATQMGSGRGDIKRAGHGVATPCHSITAKPRAERNKT